MIGPTRICAQPAFHESEPNNTPAEANAVAGAVTIMGAFEGRDQDAFVWTVSDVDAKARWTLELQGLPGTVTSVEVFRLEFADNGVDVTAKNRVLKVGSRGAKAGLAEDLLFEPGDYFLGVARAGGAAGGYRLDLRHGKKIHPDGRVPKNRTREEARKLKPRSEYAAFFDVAESWFQFEIDEDAAALRWQVLAQAPVDETVRATVLDSAGATVSKAVGRDRGLLRSEELELDPGTYYVTLGGKAEGSIRAIQIASTGPRPAPTPSDSAASAAPPAPRPKMVAGRWDLAERVDLSQPVEGRFGSAKDTRFFSFSLDEAQTEGLLALSLRSTGDRHLQLCLLDSRGDNLQCRGGEGPAELPDLVLSPGEWGVMAEGRAGDPVDFTLSLASVGSTESSSEAEPNDELPQATALAAGQRISGRLTGADEDVFRLLVTGEPQLWRFDVEGEGLKELRYYDAAGAQSQRVGLRQASSGSLSNLFLVPGKHYVSVRGDNGSYSFTATPLGPPHSDSEREPNDDASRAEVLDFGQKRFGTLEVAEDYDAYRFSLMNDEHLRLTIEPADDSQLKIWLSYGSTQYVSHRADGGRSAVLQGMFSPGDYQLRLQAQKPSRERYHVKLERLPRFGCSVDCEPFHKRTHKLADGGNPTSAPSELPVTMSLTPESVEVAAYLRFAQRIRAELKLKNNGNELLTTRLEAATSDSRWKAIPAEDAVELGPGESRVIDLDVKVPPDAWGDHPVIVSVRAVDSAGAQAETAVEIAADGGSEPVNAELSWSVPESMLGGMNATWSVLGGRVVGTTEGSSPVAVEGVGRYVDLLIDGGVLAGVGPIVDVQPEIEAVPITVELAGSQPLEIVGVILNPVGRGKPGQYLDEFEVQLSLDGSRFDSVLRGRLKPLAADQAFELDEPTPARFARLVLLGSQGKDLRNVGIGEFKVVARRDTDLSNGRGWNLADPGLGGHVAWSRPSISGNWDEEILTEAQENPNKRLRPREELGWVVSFQHQRAARIARFEWVESARAGADSRMDRVIVSASLDSPVGPWTRVADWDRDESPDELVLESPTWARYVRFSFAGQDTKAQAYAPDTLRVFEQPADEGYGSILGEWGESWWQAQYELTQGMGPGGEGRRASGNNSRATASSLTLDQRVSGRVTLGEEVDWYKLDVPAGHNTLTLELSGVPTVRTVLDLQDASGAEVALREIGRRSDAVFFRALVDPGRTYYVRVEEPPRAVIFAFDNSGSVSPFRTAIYRALSAYAGDLVPGRDVANVLPFGSPLLSNDWMGEPYILQMVLNDYDRKDQSSAAEKSLADATRALAKRPGAKAVVLVTDAATPRFDKLWNSLEEIRPRVFTMRVGNSDKTGLYEDLMQSWARVNDGHYSFLSTQVEMDRAFDRAATLLRQPAAYSLEASASIEKAPGPGRLRVVSGQDGVRGGAVALILDASGSMLKRLEGRRRIEIAKDLLSQAVGEHIPAGTPVALRVFGHQEPNSCRTDLVVPMKPLDPTAMQATLAGINAMNLAKTPIAESLAQIESDLKDATGTRVVVLVTDGEETCEGDPEAVLQKLADRGIDLRLEIVGFAIADDDLKQQFEGWAGQGGGRYFDADDIASLENSLAEAIRVPYVVFDETGTEVAEGTVDGPELVLPGGRYRVVVRSSPPRTFDEVDLAEEKSVELAIE